jgi:HPt (histidine-containing phosphotransfer) domain-containing protein
LLGRFDQSLDSSLQQIEQLIAARQGLVALQRVHAMKGEAGSMAASRLHLAAQALEQSLRAEQWNTVDRETAVLRTEVQSCRRAYSQTKELLAGYSA